MSDKYKDLSARQETHVLQLRARVDEFMRGLNGLNVHLGTLYRGYMAGARPEDAEDLKTKFTDFYENASDMLDVVRALMFDVVDAAEYMKSQVDDLARMVEAKHED